MFHSQHVISYHNESKILLSFCITYAISSFDPINYNSKTIFFINIYLDVEVKYLMSFTKMLCTKRSSSKFSLKFS